MAFKPPVFISLSSSWVIEFRPRKKKVEFLEFIGRIDSLLIELSKLKTETTGTLKGDSWSLDYRFEDKKKRAFLEGIKLFAKEMQVRLKADLW